MEKFDTRRLFPDIDFGGIRWLPVPDRRLAGAVDMAGDKKTISTHLLPVPLQMATTICRVAEKI